MSAEDLEKYETEMELSLYREYKDIVGQFSYFVETERRFDLANSVELVPRPAEGDAAVLSVSTFLKRLNELESSPARKATNKADHAALHVHRGPSEPEHVTAPPACEVRRASHILQILG